MESMEFLHPFIEYLETAPSLVVLLVFAGAMIVLGKAADVLVEQAAHLSEKSGIPKLVVGSTIVSLGTTLPEASVSVMAAIKGNPGLAIGNAVGSILCDSGLILGIALILSPIPLRSPVLQRSAWLQLGSGFFLLFCLLWGVGFNFVEFFSNGTEFSRVFGFISVGLLAIYIFDSIRSGLSGDRGDRSCIEKPSAGYWAKSISIIFVCAIFVIIASEVLIGCAEVLAHRLSIPEAIIAATLVAFGTSLPELVTAISSSRKGHGELALGNIIGADILNVLFVAGLAAAVTPGGITVDPPLLRLQLPAMLAILVLIRWALLHYGKKKPESSRFLPSKFGWVLLATYIAVTAFSFI